jgi:hypothetical protein
MLDEPERRNLLSDPVAPQGARVQNLLLKTLDLVVSRDGHTFEDMVFRMLKRRPRRDKFMPARSPPGPARCQRFDILRCQSSPLALPAGPCISHSV